jgi:thiamine biosynthesis lipoprotein
MAVDEIRFRAMASDVHVIVVDGPPEACASARRRIEGLESIWSRFIDSSDISRLNHSVGQPLQVDPATVTLMQVMGDAWRITGRRYDPTVLRALLTAGYVASIDAHNLRTSLPDPRPTLGGHEPTFGDVEVGPGRFITMPTSAAIDAGGIGKGLAADLVVAELLSRGAGGALVSIGGDLAASGDSPEADGWRVDIEDPLDLSRTLARLMISGGGVATSSTRTRRWIFDRAEHHHAIDPTTGRPSDTDLAAVTVVAPCGWQAEAHATALLLGGAAGFCDYTRSNRIEAAATTVAGTCVTTAAFSEILSRAVLAS